MILTKTACEIWLAFSLWVYTNCKDPRAQHSIHYDPQIGLRKRCKISPFEGLVKQLIAVIRVT